jgi:hypothetical protein
MSSQDPFGSTTPPERPTNPTHFGGERAYESKSQTAETSDSSDDSLLKVPRVEHVDTATRDSFVDDTIGRGSSSVTTCTRCSQLAESLGCCGS